MTCPHEGVWKLISYGVQEGKNKWNTIISETETIFLILKNMNLIVSKGSNMMDNFSLTFNDIRRIVRSKDSLAIALVQENIQARNVRFRFASTAFFSGEIMCKACAEVLANYVSVTYHGDIETDEEIDGRNHTVSLSQCIFDLLKLSGEDSCQDRKLLATVYPIEEAIQDVCLDVDFGNLVKDVKKYISSNIKMEKKSN